MPSPASSSSDTAAEANALARQFFAASAALDTFRLSFNPPLPQPDQQRLRDESNALVTRAQYFTAAAIGATLAALGGHLAGIQATTDQAISQLHRLRDVEKAVNLATSMLTLGTAIAAGDPSTILSAAQALAALLY